MRTRAGGRRQRAHSSCRGACSQLGPLVRPPTGQPAGGAVAGDARDEPAWSNLTAQVTTCCPERLPTFGGGATARSQGVARYSRRGAPLTPSTAEPRESFWHAASASGAAAADGTRGSSQPCPACKCSPRRSPFAGGRVRTRMEDPHSPRDARALYLGHSAGAAAARLANAALYASAARAQCHRVPAIAPGGRRACTPPSSRTG